MLLAKLFGFHHQLFLFLGRAYNDLVKQPPRVRKRHDQVPYALSPALPEIHFTLIIPNSMNG